HYYRHHPALHSFPTRRSSDLTSCGVCNNLCGPGTQCLKGNCTPMLPGLAARYYDRPDYWNGPILFDRIEPNLDTCNNWSAYDCRDRKSIRLNSSHSQISYAVF